MLLPTSPDILLCIERTLETIIAPALEGAAERSALATSRVMLRFVARRTVAEGALLAAEIEHLRPLLSDIARAFPKANEIATSLGSHEDGTGFRDVASLSAEVWRLRQGICTAIGLLGEDAEHRPLMDRVDAYMAWQVTQEAELIDSAFEGTGPRR